MKKTLTILLALVMALTVVLTGCGGNTDAPEATQADSVYITEKGELTVGMTIYEPMNFKAEDGSWTGFDTEFTIAVCEKLGVTPNFVEIDWDNKFPALSSKSIDCIWNGMTISDEVKLNADVSKAYVKNAQIVVMNKDVVANYADVESLKGLKFVAESGSAGEAAIADNGLSENYVAVPAQTDALLEVMSGSADACVIDITMANAMTGEGTSYADLAAGIELTSEEYGIAFRKGSDMTEKVNAIIDELKADGTLDALAEKYNLALAL